MKTWLRKILWLLLLVVSLGVMAYGWLALQPTIGDAPATSPPMVNSRPTPTLVPPASTPTPTPIVTPSPTPTLAVPVMEDINSVPVHIQIGEGDCEADKDEVLVCAGIVPVGLQAGELNPPPGQVGWYGPPDWDTIPGNLSDYPGVLVGHVSHSGEDDVFARLSEARAGDKVIITYANGRVAVFELDHDPISVGKDDVVDQDNSAYRWVWQLDESGRKVSLFTCDRSQGLDITGHSLNNWVVQATRIA